MTRTDYIYNKVLQCTINNIIAATVLHFIPGLKAQRRCRGICLAGFYGVYSLSGKEDVYLIFPKNITLLDRCINEVTTSRTYNLRPDFTDKSMKCKVETSQPLKLYYTYFKCGYFGMRTLQTLCQNGSSGRTYQYDLTLKPIEI